ncbi:hypothetical protein GCM10011349_18480 [Novosphingobium indicum]|uniref:Uncharacterized protein n=1 Tax=Novosphingobium indicum TaxID=462949 RepID=A0ABQ2JL62_9SPHN|nr:hypothetical protein [Novosphingobium indicum]GGN48623.1 hypothetical protein GCM10011349_18480 [Novosphingobium indicum]
MSFRRNLRHARSHLIIVAVLIIAGAVIVQIEDRNLQQEAGKPIPDHGIESVGTVTGK